MNLTYLRDNVSVAPFAAAVRSTSMPSIHQLKTDPFGEQPGAVPIWAAPRAAVSAMPVADFQVALAALVAANHHSAATLAYSKWCGTGDQISAAQSILNSHERYGSLASGDLARREVIEAELKAPAKQKICMAAIVAEFATLANVVKTLGRGTNNREGFAINGHPIATVGRTELTIINEAVWRINAMPLVWQQTCPEIDLPDAFEGGSNKYFCTKTIEEVTHDLRGVVRLKSGSLIFVGQDGNERSFNMLMAQSPWVARQEVRVRGYTSISNVH